MIHYKNAYNIYIFLLLSATVIHTFCAKHAYARVLQKDENKNNRYRKN